MLTPCRYLKLELTALDPLVYPWHGEVTTIVVGVVDQRSFISPGVAVASQVEDEVGLVQDLEALAGVG